jgi:hypothetical protein
VEPQRYLADSAAAAAAVREFSQELAAIGPTATRARLRAVAPELGPPLQRAARLAGRLSAERLADHRLEAQRLRVTPLLAEVVAAMGEVNNEAAAGRPHRAAEAIRHFTAAVDALGKEGLPDS